MQHAWSTPFGDVQGIGRWSKGERASKGESWAIEEVFDRVDGRIQLTPQEEMQELQQHSDVDAADITQQIEYLHSDTGIAGRKEEIERLALRPDADLALLEKCYLDDSRPLPGDKPFIRPSFEEWKAQREPGGNEIETQEQENPNE